MKTKIPYNAGELRKIYEKNYMICGHVWWPVEKCNAYHVMRVDDYGEAMDMPAEYIWDYSHGQWPVFTPKAVAA